MPHMKPRELVSILISYTENGFFKEHSKESQQFMDKFDREFRSKHDMMNPEDISKYFYCFEKIRIENDSFKVQGLFYKHL